MFYAVIMAGGTGTRLWPLSRQAQPKQALKLIGERTMFQHAVDRLTSLFPPDRIYVVTNPTMADVLRPQAPELPDDHFMLEPFGRDSAPAAGLAAIHLLRRDPDAVMAMLTADHFIVDVAQFRAALSAAEQVASEGPIVTLGIQPSYPATGFGYIELGEALTIIDGFRTYRSAGFIEKPNPERAVQFLESGRHVWNSGMFIWRADRLMVELSAQLPALHAVLMRIAAALGSPWRDQVLEAEWANAPKTSIDYGVMERAENVCVIPVDIGWSDVGSWAALLDILSGDQQGNITQGETVLLDSARCFIRSDGKLVATIGMQDTIIVDTPDVLLVCSKSRAEDVRVLVNRLAAEGRQFYL